MRITTRDRSNLARFGCAFLAKQNLICIRWEKERQHQAVSANIVSRLVHATCSSGPLLFLAFEISPTKMLPQYCFFPFDLTNKTHRNYLFSVFKKRQIHLCFLADSRPITRTHELMPGQCARFPEVYATAAADLDKFPTERYDFDRAVNELEQSVRLVDCFEYVVSETELQRAVASSRAQAAKLSAEDRAQAAKIANDLLGVFLSRPEGFIRERMEEFSRVRRALLFLSDLHRQFEGDYAGVARFVADAIAAHTPKEDNRQLETLIPLLESIFKLMDRMRETPAESNQALPAQLDADVRDFVNRLAGGKGVSIGALKSILSSFGLQLGGQPGRTPKDYSREYVLKSAGLSWRAVTKHTLENDSETRDEFGGREYSALTFEEKELLKHRIREGVRSYAKRTGKPFPPQKESKLLPPPDAEQKNPG